jgi:hypothetical protein
VLTKDIFFFVRWNKTEGVSMKDFAYNLSKMNEAEEVDLDFR